MDLGVDSLNVVAAAAIACHDLTTSAAPGARSAGAEAHEAGRGFPLQGGSEGSGRRAARGDRPVKADHGGHRGIVRDPGDARDDGG